MHNHELEKLNGRQVFYVGSKSGGHIIPSLTFAQEIRRLHPYVHQTFISSFAETDAEMIHRSQAIDHHIQIEVPEKEPTESHEYPRFIFQMSKLILKFFFLFIRNRPNYVVCTGGLIAIPVLVAARMLFVQVRWYEFNVLPGKATKFVTTWWKVRLFTCFDQTAQYVKQLPIKTAYPIRFVNHRPRTRTDALNYIKLGTERITIGVIGGSQGSTFINEALLAMLERHPEILPYIQILHQTGLPQIAKCTNFYIKNRMPAAVCAFNPNIEMFYTASDLIICRSGAGTLFELRYFGKPAITIPLETDQNNHQVANALCMQQQHPEQFTVLRQNEILDDPEALYRAVMHYLDIKPVSNPADELNSENCLEY